MPVRTGQLVVRRYSPWRRRLYAAGLAFVAIVLLYGVYEWGRFDGGYDRVSSGQQRRELAAQIDALEAENQDLRAQVAAAEVARSVDSEAYGDVERTLGELQAQLLRQSEELAFYRGIVSPADGIGGLRIQRFEVLPTSQSDAYRLRFVLVQSMRQDRVASGTVKIEFEGTSEGRPVRIPLADAAPLERRDGRLPFSFRYFQNIEQDIALPAGFEPEAVSVEVKAAREQPLRQSFPWQVQAG